MSWLDECARLGRWWTWMSTSRRCTATGEASAPPRPLGSEPKLSQEAASQDPRGEKRGSKQGKGTLCLKSSAGLPVTVAAAEPQRQRSSLPAVPNPLTRQALAKEAEEEAAAEAAAVARSALEKDQNRPPNADTGFSMEPGAGTGTELPATAIAMPEPNRDVATRPEAAARYLAGLLLRWCIYRLSVCCLWKKRRRQFISAGGICAETAAAMAYVVCQRLQRLSGGS